MNRRNEAENVDLSGQCYIYEASLLEGLLDKCSQILFLPLVFADAVEYSACVLIISSSPRVSCSSRISLN